jgi:hypothetical protein
MDHRQWEILQQMLALGAQAKRSGREFMTGESANQVPGMGSTANAGGFTSGQMRSRPEDRLAFDYFGFVPGHGAMPQGMPGTPSGPTLTPEMVRYLMQIQGR